MKKYESYSRVLPWLMAMLLSALAAGCGGNGDPILGADGITAKLTVPTVTFTDPLDLADELPINRAISASFSEAMDAVTINTLTAPATFTVKQTLEPQTPVLGAVSYDAISHSATFKPTAVLAVSTQYTGTITAAAKSASGVPMASAYSWTFTTGPEADLTAPLLLLTEPANAAINVPVNQTITATFNKPMDPSKICGPAALTTACPVATFTVVCIAPTSCPTPAGVVSYVGTSASFTPTVALQAGATYTATIAASDLAGNAWVAGGTQAPNPWTFDTSDSAAVHLGPAPVVLGATQPYGVLSNTTVTLGGDGVTGLRVDGDVGIFPAGACNGCVAGPSGSVSGVIESGTVPASDAMLALAGAYSDAMGRSSNVCTLIGSGKLTTNPAVACGGTANGTFAPGLYWSSTSIEIPAGKTITLDAQNDSSAVFIFRSESTINSIGGNTHVVLANGAQAKNVFWVAGSSATIGGTNSDFAGTVLVMAAITVNTGTQMLGRALARGAAVTVQDGAKITVPAP
jgi:hypothetical protein